MSKYQVDKIPNKRKKYAQLNSIFLCVISISIFVGSCFLYTILKSNNNSNNNNNNNLNFGIDDTKYAISSSCKEAVQTGSAILDEGGNAVDAAIAMSYTLGVAEPQASGIGGGGCMLIYDPTSNNYYFYNYGSVAAKSNFSKKILVPGFVDGMDTIKDDFGTLEYDELLKYAISYCDGIIVDQDLASRINNASGSLSTDSAFYKDEDWLKEGDLLVQTHLKECLNILLDEGPESFYKGTIAKMINKEIGMPLSDLSSYETRISNPVIESFGDYEIASASMPYSGTTLIQMLKMAEKLDITSPNEDRKLYLDQLDYITLSSHLDRIKNVYDYSFYNKELKNYTNDTYINHLLSQRLNDIEYEDESEDTTSFTVIDKDGMVVSCTNTLSGFFGCKKSVCGFYMNNTGRNFGVGVNAYAPGKQPRTHIAPTILRNDNEIIAIASPGGNVIVKVLGNILIDICLFNTKAEDAISKQRILFKQKDLIYYETGYKSELICDPRNSGYRIAPVSNHSYFGCVTYCHYSLKNGFYAVTDIRRQGDSVYKN